MKVDRTVLFALCWILIVTSLAGADFEAKANPNTSLDSKGSSTLNNSNDKLNGKTDDLRSGTNTSKVDHVIEGKDQAGRLEKAVEDNKLNEGNAGEKKQLGAQKDNNQEKDKVVDKKIKSDKASESIGASKEGTVRKAGSHAEECDNAPNSCTDEKNELVACLRVPGNESPELSLLVQNWRKGPLSVTISAPDFVKLEKTQIQLREKEETKVKVSIKKSGSKSFIVLTAGSGNCTLNFQDIVVALNLNKEIESTDESTHIIDVIKRTPLIAFIAVGAVLVAALAWFCISYQKKHLASRSSKYQKLDMELPVSGGAKVEFDSNDGWDNSWGDDWDDEEASKTPLMPVTPSLSSKGLAPRRLNKEGWKD